MALASSRTRSFELAAPRVNLALAGLGALVALSFLARLLVGRARVTPAYFQDEYLYAELARSLIEYGRPLVRGADSEFPALLQPILTAPAWLLGDVADAYHLAQAVGALSMSLAAIPVFVLARRLGLGAGLALACAAYALMLPQLEFASWIVAEPFAYPLVLGAVASGTASLAGGGRQAQVVFVACALLAAFARAQFAILPLVFLAALVTTGLRERRLGAALREQRLPLALIAVPVAALVVAGPTRALGGYEAVLGFELEPAPLLEWAGANALVLAYASGWALLPGALMGLSLALFRPRSRAEVAFAAFVVVLGALLLFEAAFVAANETGRIHERYGFAVLPFLPLAFCLYAVRGWPLRLRHALLAGAFLCISALVPLSGYTAGQGKADSPFLGAAFFLERLVGDVSNASLLVAAAATVVMIAVVTASARPKAATPVVLALSLAACTLASAGAAAFDLDNAREVRRDFLPADPSWVDRAALGDVALLHGPGTPHGAMHLQLFWNRSVQSVLGLPGSDQIDSFASRVRVAPDGSLLLSGRRYAGPLLVEGYGTTIRLTGVEKVASGPTSVLFRPHGTPRLSLYMTGRYADGWLDLAGALELWPSEGRDLSGTVLFTAMGRPDGRPVTLSFVAPGEAASHITVAPGSRAEIKLLVCSSEHWQAQFQADAGRIVRGRPVSVRTTEPVFRADPGACKGRKA